MSVMSVGKKPKALVRSLGAGNSRAGAHGASRVRVSLARRHPGQASEAFPVRRWQRSRESRRSRPRPRARKPPARPRLWVVPDVADPDVARPDAAEPNAAAPNVAGPKVVVPRPRVAADEQIPARLPSTRPAGAPSRTRVVRPASVPSRVPVQRVRRTRLTRRGRRVLWAFAVLLLVAVITPLLLALASGAQASSHGLPPSAVRAGMRQVVVKPGQSLWSVALNAEPQADPRVVIQQIMEFNALGSQVVVPGESLWVPRG